MTRVLRRTDLLVLRSVLGMLVPAWLVLLAIDAFTALADELGDVGKGNYTIATAFVQVGWTLPRRAWEAFPVAAVIGALAGLGALAPSAELTAMRAGGLSKLRIALAAAGAVLVLLVPLVVAGETFVPWAEHHAQSLQASAQSRDLVATRRTGLWARDGDSLLHARRGERRGDSVVLYELKVYEFDPDGRLRRLSLAARAEHGADGWTLHEVVRQTFGDGTLGSETLADAVWPSAIDPRLLALSVVKPRSLGLADLAEGIAYRERNQLDASEWRAAYWRRVFYAVNVLVLVMVALPFAFGSLRSGGLAKRLLFGILLSTGWTVMQRGVMNVAAVYGLDHRLTQLLPALALALAAAWYFRRHA